ncbi:hypothetical protein L3Q67_31280 [Saccharothrix sp. AJ9571]|nr:hypothetical protein L3Q67_31280 [Saccharothrix sp. AJ9571]
MHTPATVAQSGARRRRWSPRTRRRPSTAASTNDALGTGNTLHTPAGAILGDWDEVRENPVLSIWTAH